MRRLLLLLVLVGCDGSSPSDGGTPDAGAPEDAGTPDAAVDVCEGFTTPARADTSRCDAPDVDAPETLTACLLGSGHAGTWTVDADGLPAYDLTIDQRCDPAGMHWSPRPDPQRDPMHLLGNGRGLVAMAHASGGIEIWTQDRGHAWINKVDTWVDPRNRAFPPQLGGGFSYLSIDGRTRSTRFEDLPVGEALDRQTRRFGVGYFETVTRWDDLVVTRRVYAPETDARALITEVTVENTSGAPLDVGLIELWDPNLHQASVELATSDVAGAPLMVTANIDRRRRAFVEAFTQTAAWSASEGLARVDSVADAPPVGRPRAEPSRTGIRRRSTSRPSTIRRRPRSTVPAHARGALRRSDRQDPARRARGGRDGSERDRERARAADAPRVPACRCRSRRRVGDAAVRAGYAPGEQPIDVAELRVL
ncbi:MAG: hypothetical protein R3B82_11705 [Sandaracinaceae bacterium]